jgi:hypothetical protein
VSQILVTFSVAVWVHLVKTIITRQIKMIEKNLFFHCDGFSLFIKKEDIIHKPLGGVALFVSAVEKSR